MIVVSTFFRTKIQKNKILTAKKKSEKEKDVKSKKFFFN